MRMEVCLMSAFCARKAVSASEEPCRRWFRAPTSPPWWWLGPLAVPGSLPEARQSAAACKSSVPQAPTHLTSLLPAAACPAALFKLPKDFGVVLPSSSSLIFRKMLDRNRASPGLRSNASSQSSRSKQSPPTCLPNTLTNNRLSAPRRKVLEGILRPREGLSQALHLTLTQLP